MTEDLCKVHQLGYVHGDIRCANIIFSTADGETAGADGETGVGTGDSKGDAAGHGIRLAGASGVDPNPTQQKTIRCNL